jgi:hypothetical protein
VVSIVVLNVFLVRVLPSPPAKRKTFFFVFNHSPIRFIVHAPSNFLLERIPHFSLRISLHQKDLLIRIQISPALFDMAALNTMRSGFGRVHYLTCEL